jgi:hypothetical protein
MKLQFSVAAAVWLASSAALAADYAVAPLEQAPPKGVSAEISKLLAPAALKITRGNRVECEIWLLKQWPAKEGFKPSTSILYPFEMGELMGVIHFPRKAGDFRGQEIPSGVYTLRYALQPEDGNHIGTSETRDFLLMLPVAADTAAKPLDKDLLFKLSKEAAETTHPAMLSLLPAKAGAASTPAMEHDEARELWSVRAAGKATAAGKTNDLVIQLVVAGKAAE